MKDQEKQLRQLLLKYVNDPEIWREEDYFRYVHKLQKICNEETSHEVKFSLLKQTINEDGQTALHSAMKKHDACVLELLLTRLNKHETRKLLTMTDNEGNRVNDRSNGPILKIVQKHWKQHQVVCEYKAQEKDKKLEQLRKLQQENSAELDRIIKNRNRIEREIFELDQSNKLHQADQHKKKHLENKGRILKKQKARTEKKLEENKIAESRNHEVFKNRYENGELTREAIEYFAHHTHGKGVPTPEQLENRHYELVHYYATKIQALTEKLANILSELESVNRQLTKLNKDHPEFEKVAKLQEELDSAEKEIAAAHPIVKNLWELANTAVLLQYYKDLVQDYLTAVTIIDEHLPLETESQDDTNSGGKTIGEVKAKVIKHEKEGLLKTDKNDESTENPSPGDDSASNLEREILSLETSLNQALLAAESYVKPDCYEQHMEKVRADVNDLLKLIEEKSAKLRLLHEQDHW